MKDKNDRFLPRNIILLYQHYKLMNISRKIYTTKNIEFYSYFKRGLLRQRL